jgi:class 3 adenylate cyclase/tetratricopeptide (TPR) repeat protein
LPDRAERRQLTLLFCDLVDSVGLSVRLDPEDLRELIVAYQQTCAKAVAPYEGYVARYAGDGVLVYFGYPAAHEDDAERAVRAGLALVGDVSRLGREQFPDMDLRVRVGIATGLVIVGRVEAQGVLDRDAVVGEAANLAARLQGLAEPNTVVVSEVTRELAGEMFEYHDLGAQPLKGFTAPVTAWQVMGLREVTRLEARGVALTPFVNRQQEIDLLLDGWRRASAGEGQVIALVGQGGIGKSRLIAEAMSRIGGETAPGQAPIVLQYSPFHSNTPLYPVVRHLVRQAGIAAEDPQALKRDKLVRLWGDAPAARESLPLIVDLVGIAPDPTEPPLQLGPVVKRHRTFEALVDWFALRGPPGAATIVFEDVQWIDPTSRLLLRRLIDAAKAARIFIVLTLRTAQRSEADRILGEVGLADLDAGAAAHVMVCELRELEADHGRALARAAAASRGGGVAGAQLDVVLAKSGGIPLYLEELVKAAASGVVFAPDREPVAAGGAVPSTISDALMAQLDRLGAAKGVAQHAAVIGHEFSLGLLARVTERSLDDLLPALRSLIEQRVVVRSNASPDGYGFKHALIRDVAYRSLLRMDRRQIHRAVAHELARHPSETITASDDLIARHYARGGEPREAIRFWRRAAGQAIVRSANEEAIAILQLALDELAKLREPEQPAVELDLVLSQAMALRSVRGYSAPEVEQRLKRAHALCEVAGDLDDRFSVEWGLFQCTFVKGDIAGARSFAAGLLRHAGQDAGPRLIDAHLANGMVAFNAGEFAAAVGFHEAGARLSRPETDQPRFLTHGQNAGLFCLSYLARTQCVMGHLDRGRATIQRARTIAAMRSKDPGHIHSSLNVALHAVRVYHLCGDLEAERQLANEIVEMARQNHYAYYQAQGRCHLGWVAGAEGDLAQGIALLTDGITALKQTGTSLALPGFYVLLAQLYVRAERRDEAAGLLGLASGPKGFALWDADIERVRGDVLAGQEGAEAAYRASLTIARKQGAALLACKAALGLAQRLEARGRRQEAHDLLAECLEPLREGGEVTPIRNARTMMQELAGAV